MNPRKEKLMKHIHERMKLFLSCNLQNSSIWESLEEKFIKCHRVFLHEQQNGNQVVKVEMCDGCVIDLDEFSTSELETIYQEITS